MKFASQNPTVYPVLPYSRVSPPSLPSFTQRRRSVELFVYIRGNDGARYSVKKRRNVHWTSGTRFCIVNPVLCLVGLFVLHGLSNAHKRPWAPSFTSQIPTPRSISRSFLPSVTAARLLQEKGTKVTYETGIFKALTATRETLIMPA